MKNAEQQQREPIVFKTTYLSKIGIRTLAEHALGLPTTNPARSTITGLVKRWTRDGTVVEFTEDGEMVEPLSREEAIGILAAATDDGPTVAWTLADRFGITEAEIDAATVEAVMEEAA